MFYRKDFYEAEGISVPKTTEEQLNVAKLFTNNPKYPGLYGIALLSGKAYSGCGYTWNAMAVGSFYGEPILDKDYKVQVNTKPWIDALAYLVELNKYTPPGGFDMIWEQQAEAFRQGIVASFVQWDIQAASIENPDKSKVVGKLGVATVPSIDGEPTSVTGVWGAGINKDSKVKDAAWELLKWITSYDIQVASVLLGMPPSMHAVCKDPRVLAVAPWMPVIEDAARYGKMYRPQAKGYQEMIDILALEYQAALSGDKTPEQAAADAQKALEAVAVENGYPQ